MRIVRSNREEAVSRRNSPERQLWLAVLRRAADDLFMDPSVIGVGPRGLLETEKWISEDNPNRMDVAGFEWLCIQLDLNIEEVRERFRQILDYRNKRGQVSDSERRKNLHEGQGRGAVGARA